ncbi:uncharacterized protein [Amphiura filiformis]|uniref:uncharacterized protein n=1 Tax=Amphiura filiformis TaxID=82378 RepID=UPI003B228DED
MTAKLRWLISGIAVIQLCIASVYSVTITLREGPGSIVNTNGNKVLTASVGDTFILICTVAGRVTTGIWHHDNSAITVNGDVVADDGKYDITVEDRGNTDMYVLQIQSINVGDAGEYLCRSGSDVDSINLLVAGEQTDGGNTNGLNDGSKGGGDGKEGKGSTDGRIRITSAVAVSPTSIQVNWEAGITSGIDGFVLDVVNADELPVAEKIVPPSSVSTTMENLQPDTVYKVALHDFIGRAMGQQSDFVNVRTLSEPDQDPCLSSPCRDGAICVEEGNGYICQCSPGWTGDLCDIRVTR